MILFLPDLTDTHPGDITEELSCVEFHMSTSHNPTVPEKNAIPVERFKTHSPEMYTNSASKVAKYFNLKVLDILQMSFDTGTEDEMQFLDIGCGTGQFTREDLLPRCLPCKRIVATDVSEDMLDYAKKNYSHPQIVYDIMNIGGDVSSFVEHYGQFQRVYSFFCLHWVKDKEVVMNNISRLLTSGGECLLLFGIWGHTFKNWQLIGEMERWKPFKNVRTEEFLYLVIFTLSSACSRNHPGVRYRCY